MYQYWELVSPGTSVPYPTASTAWSKFSGLLPEEVGTRDQSNNKINVVGNVN